MKLTKKILALVLSVLMVVTMLPMSVLAATVNSAEDANAVALKNAITAYENKMDGSKFYTNMSTAYSAYVDANEAYDAYVYGDATVDLVSATNALTTATNNMGTWSVPTLTTKTATWPANGGTSMPSDAYVNVAYAEDPSADNIGHTVSGKNTTFYVRFPNSTLIYDGVTVPSVAVMAVVEGESNKNRYVYSLVLTDNNSNSLYLKGNWHGTAGEGNNWDYSWVSEQAEALGTSSTSSSFNIQVSQASGLVWNRWNHPTGLTNVMKYNTDFASGVYYKEITPSFSIYAGSGSSFTNSDITATIAANQTIKVVNYKAIPNALTANANKLNLKGGNYAQGGAADLIAKFEAAMNFDVMSYFTSSNDYTGCANGIKSAVDNLTNAAKTADDAKYQTLRTSISDSRSTFNSSDEVKAKYTADSWAAFETAFTQAQAVMANLPSTGYTTATDAQAKATALNDAKANLQVNSTPADTFIIENTIDDALIAIEKQAYFTSDSFTSANLASLVAQAQTEIWGSTENYKNKASAVDESEQAMVDAWVVTVGEAIAILQIDTNVTVNTANGYSLVTALANAQSKNKDDYSNYADLATQITKAQKFEAKVITDTTDTSSFRTGIVQAKIDEYEKTVEELVQAIFNLRLSFAKLEDGTVASSETGTVVIDSIGCNHNDGKYYKVTYNYPNNTIIFKTTHAQKVAQLPDASISMFAGTAANRIGPGFLDSLNLASSFSGETAEITSNYDDRDSSMSADQRAQYPGSLVLSPVVGGTSYVYQLGYNAYIKNSGIFGVSPSNTGYFGLDSSGNQVTSATFDWTNSLGATEGYSVGNSSAHGALAAGIASGFTARATVGLQIPATSIKTPTAATRPSMTTVPVANNANLQAIVKYGYPGAAARVYHGYTAKTAAYSQTVYVVDIAYLIDLIKECDALTFSSYTASSWNNFAATLTATKDEMNYAEMTADQILAECQKRYDNLFAARAALVEAATNDNLHAAINAAVEIRNNGKDYTNSTKSVFNEKYNAAVAAINGTYSDEACLDLVKTQHQASIDALATELTNAIANLEEQANFDDLQVAYSSVLTLADKTYTVASLQSLVSVLNKATYIYKTVEEKGEIGASNQASVDAETTSITNAINALETTTVDATAFDAAKVEIENRVTDPDAWDGVDDAKAYIDSQASRLYENVTILGNTVIGVALTQTEIDQIVTEAETKFRPMQYKVFVNGTEYDTYDFGQEARVILDQESDIFYAYQSNTTSNTKKYFATDKAISFVVKGNTYLTTEPVKNSSTETFKVTYKNALNNKVIAIDYVTAGENAVLPSAPSVAYYEFTGYTVDGAPFDGTNITSNVTVLANYQSTTAMPTITVHYTYAPDVADNTSVYEYNEVVTLHQDNAIYWIQFNSEEDFNTWRNGEEASAPIDHVVYYGDTYKFRAHEDVYLASLTQEDYEMDQTLGFIDPASVDVPEVKAANGYIDAGEKISMIGTFKLNAEKYELVEAGMLVAKNHTTDLKDIKNATASNGIYRLKSSQHTAGNQFVISLATANMPSTQAISYVPYMIYKDEAGVNQVVYGDIQFITYSK